jgi:hypothetical protein
MYYKIRIKFDYGEIDIYRSWIMALFLLEDRDFKGFCRKFGMRGYLWNSGTVNVKYTVIELNLYLMVHSIVLKFEKIWLSGTLIIIWKPKVTDGRTDMRIPIYSRLSSSGGIIIKKKAEDLTC